MKQPINQSMRSQSGFSLLEVLLAFVIFAISFAVVLEILSGSMRGSKRAEHFTSAALVAQSVMDRVGLEIPLEEGSHSGEEDGGYLWDMNISQYQPVSDEDRIQPIAESTGTEILKIDLNVEWDTGRRQSSEHFSTLRAVLANRN